MEELTIWEQHTITLNKVSVWSGDSECVWFEMGVDVEGARGSEDPATGFGRRSGTQIRTGARFSS